MASNILFIESVLSPDHCERLISDFMIEQVGPSLDYNKLERKKVTDNTIVVALAKKYGFVYDRAFILRYKQGDKSPLHVDNVFVNNSKIESHGWIKSVIVFLNDNFEGGELVYPDQGVTIRPKVGNMVVAPADSSSPHYVTETTSDRYVLVLRLVDM